MVWVASYERAWRSDDQEAIAALFTEDVLYRRSPVEPSEVGHSGIRSFWSEEPGTTFLVAPHVVAVDDPVAVVRVDVHYRAPRAQEYRNLWILRFAADGRVADFEEWAYWPGRPYSAERHDEGSGPTGGTPG